MSLKHFNLILNTSGDLEVGKTYYKDSSHDFPIMPMPKIKILSDEGGGMLTAQIGDDTHIHTITETEAFYYINHQGGYHDTP